MNSYKPTGVCAREIQFEVVDNKVGQVNFIGGCAGNALGLSALVKGMDVNEAIDRLKGIDCRTKGTSCPDQLAKALEQHITSC